MSYICTRNVSGSKFPLKTVEVYLLVITIPPPPNRTLFLIFFFLENLDTKNQSVLLIGDFNAPNFDWERGLPLPNCNFYSKLKVTQIYISICLLGLTQCLLTDNSLDPIFTNFSRVNLFFADVGVVEPDSCHLSIFIEIPLDLHNSTSYHEHSYRKYALGVYSLLFSFLSNHDWSCVYSNNSRCCSRQFYQCYYSSYGFINTLWCYYKVKIPSLVFSHISLLYSGKELFL
jgi:hypothetical protein